MRSQSEVARYSAELCSIANAAADTDGFVPVRRILEAFRTRVVLRPLLVEAMLARTKNASNADAAELTILVDAEKTKITLDQIQSESAISPLPARVRNTIAHELVHLLPLRHLEGAKSAPAVVERRVPQSDRIREIESSTEDLSPLLLIPDRGLSQILDAAEEPISFKRLLELRNAHGVSRQVLIRRLVLYRHMHESRLGRIGGLSNLGIGLAKGVADDSTVICKWPQFHSFDSNYVPALLLDAQKAGDALARNYFVDDTFALAGGSRLTTDQELAAGTLLHPAAVRFFGRVDVERPIRRQGDAVMFSVRKA
jgi:hypothetical protein